MNLQEQKALFLDLKNLKTPKERCSHLKLLHFKKIGEGAVSKVFSKKELDFVIKIETNPLFINPFDHNLPNPLKKFFLEYYLKDNITGVAFQKKVKRILSEDQYFKWVSDVEDQFDICINNIEIDYDIHNENLGYYTENGKRVVKIIDCNYNDNLINGRPTDLT